MLDDKKKDDKKKMTREDFNKMTLMDWGIIDHPELREMVEKHFFENKIEQQQSPIEWDLPKDFEDIKNTPPIDWVWEDLIPANQIGMFIGDGGSFKSALSLYLCVCIATGTKLLGKEVKPGKAVYLSHEDNRIIVHQRLANIIINMGLESKWDLIFENMKVIIYDDLEPVFDTPQAFDEYLLREKIENEKDIRIFIIDTFRQHNPTGKENSGEDILPVFLSAKKYLKHCSVMFLHHVNKNSTYSGHTSLKTNSRFMLNIEKDSNNGCVLEVTKSNYASTKQSFGFKFVFDETSKYRLVSEDEYSNTETQLKVFFDLLVKNDGLVVKQDMMDSLEIERESAYKIAWGKLKEKIERDYFKIYISSNEVTDWTGKKHKVKGKQLYVTRDDYDRYLSKKEGK